MDKQITKWTPSEYAFLAGLYQQDNRASDKAFAYSCERKFAEDGRPRTITLGSIKGALHRLRERGQIMGAREGMQLRPLGKRKPKETAQVAPEPSL